MSRHPARRASDSILARPALPATLAIAAAFFLAMASASTAQVKIDMGSKQSQKAKTPDVAIAASLSRDTLAAGSSAEMLFSFTPAKGFHVNAVPPMAVAFDSGAPAKSGGKLVIPSDTATGYLKAAGKVRQPIALLASAPKGRGEIRGALTYYYCSDAEGWCRKESMRFTVPVTVK